MGNLTFGCCNFIVINFYLFFIHHVIPPCGISQVTCTLYLYYSALYLDILSVTLYRVTEYPVQKIYQMYFIFPPSGTIHEDYGYTDTPHRQYY